MVSTPFRNLAKLLNRIVPEEDEYFEPLDDEEEWFDSNPYDPRSFGEGKGGLEEEVRLYLFHRGRGRQLSAHFRREKLLSAHWSEAYQELSLMLKDAGNDMHLVKGSFTECSDETRPGKVWAVARYPFLPEGTDRQAIDPCSFMMGRVSEEEHIFTNSTKWHGNMGKWNIATGEMISLCCFDSYEQDMELNAVCGIAGEIYGLVDHAHIHRFAGNEISQNEFASNFALFASSNSRLELIPERQMLLILTKGVLQLVDLETSIL